MYRFLTINPGSTSTKVALFEGSDSWSLSETARRELSISRADLEHYPDAADQMKLRSRQIEVFLSEEGDPELSAVAGRGGLTRPLEAGSYAVNEAMVADLLSARYGNHASNLGALIARDIAAPRGVPALIADPVGVDQFDPLSRYSGWPELPRLSQLHALNMRSVAREAARQLGVELFGEAESGREAVRPPGESFRAKKVLRRPGAMPGEGKAGQQEVFSKPGQGAVGDPTAVLEDWNFIIAHLGGGISVAPMKRGRLVDVNNAMDGGPFSPQRTGSLPLRGLVNLAFSGRWESAKQMLGDLTRKGGLFAYLGTDDGREIVRRIESGDGKAEDVYRAMARQISKEIGAMAAVLEGRVDAIILTGGLAHPPLTDWISASCGWIARLVIIPGERELLALAQAAARHVCEGEELLPYEES